ncbi:excitatory amino acid transporter 3 [Orussus abietinus]|uniref:excitatory amino acid transporter 3 n=1 Tax=Orussus abietinus TaxID=222816 RepID=UPI000625754F|nr:excitatory amino acid transporter 3 [Orussus abietinus]
MDTMRPCVMKHHVTVMTLSGIIIGIGIGGVLKNYATEPWSEREIMYFQFPGELFLRIINCLIVPLVVSSIVSATCTLSSSGTIGLTALYYYSTTTALGIITSVILAQTVKPGEVNRKTHEADKMIKLEKHFVTVDIFLDLLRNVVPDNLVNACMMQYHTVLKKPKNTSEVPIYEWPTSYEYTEGTNILGLVFFSILLGLAIGKMKEDRKPLVNFFHAIFETTAVLMNKVIIIAPVGVLFLTVGRVLEIEDFSVMMARLGAYVCTVFAGLFIHGLFTLPLLHLICTRRSPYKIIAKLGPALATAFGTSSSTATVPMTIRCLDKIGVDPTISRFVAPIGATINMDGIALYESIGAIFVIQLRGLDFSLMKIISISITCTLSCIGAAGLPSGGYMMLVTVLSSMGIPAQDVMLIIAIDGIVDRFRTTINIIADALGTSIIAHFIGRNDGTTRRSINSVDK